MLTLAMWGFLLTAGTLLALVTWKYRTPFHPLLMPFLSLAVMSAFAPLAQQAAGLKAPIPDGPRLEASLLCTLYAFGLALPLLTNLNPLLPLMQTLARPAEVIRRDGYAKIYLLLAVGLWGAFAFGFLMLIRDSSEGWTWLTDPRKAYREGRAGVGHWWVSAQACLFLSMLVLLWFLRIRKRLTLIAITLFYAYLFLYFGSKNGVLGVLVAGLLYYNFYIRPVGPVLILAAILGAIPVVFISPLLQGNFESFRGTLTYYDYFDNSAAYLYRHERFGTMYGEAGLSSLWEYVPRGFFPQKPFIYGVLVINEEFFPGAAKVGHTPALLPWTAFHLDFGATGVFAGAVAVGFLQKGVYTYFLRTRSFVGFITLLQACFIPVLKFAPILYFAVMILLLAIGLRAGVTLLWTATRGERRRLAST